MQKINLLILLTTVVFCIFLLEIFVRVFIPQQLNVYQYDKDYIFKFKPFAKFTFKDSEINNLVVFNSKGFHDNEFIDEKNILMLGDSMITGIEVGINETIANVLEKKIGIEVINAGVSGYSTEQELIYLKKKGINFNPEIIILAYYVGNDQTDNLERNIFKVENNTLSVNTEKHFFNSKIRSVYYLLAGNSHLINLVFKFYYFIKEFLLPRPPISFTSINKNFIFENYYLKNETEFSKKAWKKTDLLLKEMNNYVVSKNKTFILVAIPEQSQEDYKIRKELIFNHTISEEDVVWDLPQKKLKEISLKYNITFIDLLDDFIKNNDKKLHFNTDFHWTGEGHNIAGLALYEKLLSTTKIK